MIDARKPIAERTGEREIKIRWDNAPTDVSVNVYVGTQPYKIEKTNSIGVLSDGECVIGSLAPGTRYFFELVIGDEAAGRVIGERRIAFEGAHNFRDLGGYETQDGRHVHWGKIYRSDHLSELTEGDLRYMENLGIRLICDFRAQEEIAKQPNRVPANDPPVQINPDIMGTALMPGEIQAAIMNGNPDGLDFGQLLIDGNRHMATQALDQYRELFARLEREDSVPLLFHCTAGKDRTGVGSALILLALGVPEKTVMWDYMLTGFYTSERVEQWVRNFMDTTTQPIDFEAVKPILSVRREYLGAAFEAIRDGYGTVDRYLEDAMLLTKPRLEALRERLLR